MITQEHAESTIAAIATPPGPGGIGVVRISGPDSLNILKQLFHPRHPQKKYTSHKMYYGWIRDPATKNTIDEVLAVYMRAPHTYTRDDVVEIHCHGSYLVLQAILARVLSAGARLADPGEFTKHAFLNGRIDLTQAEAVLELLQAKTGEGLDIAAARLKGQLRDRVSSIRDALLSVRSIIEVAIDFPDEDAEILNPLNLKQDINQNVLAGLEALIVSADRGKIFLNGISVVILGRPNVGKSSLLNALLQEDRAIVTAAPGTTRDTIEEYLNIKGMPVRIIDTAGIREDAEDVEEIGILRARRKLEQADLVLLLVDASVGPTNEDYRLYESMKERPLLLVVNKIDIAFDLDLSTYKNFFPGPALAAVSAKTRKGLGDLETAIFNFVTAGSLTWDPGHTCVPNVRHAASLKKAYESSKKVLDGLEIDLPPDLLAIELQAALDYLGDIVGQTTTEDVLDKIFSEFCIGK
ncbi:MAG: tRNA uridine-5-carboxymethylaminomethyl(34) synthesis GTPase MnmE [Thermodesulfobacteriota bacterium]|nr:tRNA uridine-5-carboxymethylaminomethyl(34) synthesis GTPase MnmE [Thermodesulfobacteriota bacterium]